MSNQLARTLPEGWSFATLGQVSECILGGTPSTEVPQFWGGDVPWMASGDVHLRRVKDVPGRITALGLRSSNATLTSPPAVAVGLAGQGKTRGTVALTLCTLSTNQSIALLKANGNDLSTDYLFHNLDSRYEELRARSSGGGRGGLSKAILEFVPIDLPPLREQQKIAQILDTLDTAIHETEAIIAKLKAVRRGLLHDLLTRGIDANCELRPTQAEAPQHYKKSPLGFIPKEWDVATLEAVSIAVTSGSRDWARFYADSGALFVRIGNLTREHINFRFDSTIYVRPPRSSDGQRTLLEPGDILISITADLGIVGVVPAEIGEAYINQHIALVRPNLSGVNPRFVGHYLASPVAQEFISKLNDAGAKAGLNLPTVRRLLTARPEPREQNLIAERLDEVDNRVQNATTESAKLHELKAGLMDDLLTGRIRVTPLLAAAERQKQCV